MLETTTWTDPRLAYGSMNSSAITAYHLSHAIDMRSGFSLIWKPTFVYDNYANLDIAAE